MSEGREKKKILNEELTKTYLKCARLKLIPERHGDL